MKNKWIVIVIIFIVLISTIVGVVSYFSAAKSSKEITPSRIPETITQAHNTFGINAIKVLNQEKGNNNIFISPTSISLALSMVYNGANGETKNAMQKTLQFQNLDITTVNQESLKLINILKNPDVDVELSVANSIWAKKGVDFNKNFLNVVSRNFNAEVSTLDFSKPNAADTINAWASKNTKGKIPTIVSPPISDAVMFLINAVYFKGSWTTEFDSNLTSDRNFKTADGVSKKLSLMQKQGYIPYLETNDFQSVNLSYGKNKRLSMYVFLPKNIDKFVQTLDENKWNSWLKEYQENKGTILLPKFKMEYEKSLIPLLTKLGMSAAFQDSADFNGIGNNLKISKVLHKTFIEVNEKGTEAAALTSVDMILTGLGAPPAKKPFYMEVNRPFFIAISDNQTQEILFMGVIKNP